MTEQRPLQFAADPGSGWYALRTGTRRWRVPAAEILEVIPRPRITPVPRSQPEVIGIFQWNGALVPLVQAGGEAGAAPRAFVAVVRVRSERGESPLGIAADEVYSCTADDDCDWLDIAALASALGKTPQ